MFSDRRSMDIAEEIFSTSRNFKATIERLDSGNHEVTVYKFTHEIVPGYGEVCEPFWEKVSPMRILAGTISEAKSVAIEELASISGEVISEKDGHST